VRDAYAALTADQQSQIQEFLGTLGRIENVNAAPVDLSGFILEQTSSFIDAIFPAGTLVPHGGYVIVARNASKAQFQSFYGKTLDANVLYFTGGGQFPNINGSETFAVLDPQRVIVDGASVAEPQGGGRTFSRTNCGA